MALNRKNALFAGSDGGGEHWSIIASLIETCKLNSVDPHAYLTDVITKIVDGHPNSRIDELLPWAIQQRRPNSKTWPENSAYVQTVVHPETNVALGRCSRTTSRTLNGSFRRSRSDPGCELPK